MKSRNFYILFILFTVFGLAKASAEEQINYTVLKEWSTDINLNGAFELERRAWLASIREEKKEQRLKLKYGEYIMASNQKSQHEALTKQLLYLGK